MLMLCYAKSNHPQDIITMLSFISAVGVYDLLALNQPVVRIEVEIE